MSASMFYGDCLEVMAGLPDKSVDCFICDLPYGCLSVVGNKNLYRAEPGKQNVLRNDNTNVKGCQWDVPLNLDAFWTQVKRLRKSDNSPCLMFCTTKFGFELYNSNPKEFRYDLVWDKQRGVSFLTANKMPMRSHEMIYVFSKSGAYYNRVDVKGDFKNWVRDRSNNNSIHCIQYNMKREIKSQGGDGKRCVLSVIQNSTSSSKSGHPTEKPEALYRFLIERYCPADGTMLDPTAGSFNSVFTALAMGRDGVGIEKDKGFFLKAKARAMAYSGGL